MRYTKAALLLFGLGSLLGLAVVAAEIFWLGRVASGIMALGLVLLPLALIADGRGFAILRLRRKPKKRRAPVRSSTRSRPPARTARRSRR